MMVENWSSTSKTIFLCIGACLSIITFVVSCIVSNNWWPCFTLGIAALLPLPSFITSSMGQRTSGNKELEGSMLCSTTFIAVGTIALPLVQLHLGVIASLQFWLIILSYGIFALTLAPFIHHAINDPDASFYSPA